MLTGIATIIITTASQIANGVVTSDNLADSAKLWSMIGGD